MPTVTLNRNVVEQIIGEQLPEEQLKDRISMIGTDLEEMSDTEIHVEIFPDRPDMLSEQGFGRALSAFVGKNTGIRQYTVNPSEYRVKVDKSVAMRPFTACAVVKGLSFDDERIREIMQAQEKLATTHGRSRKKSAYGIYPLDKINFPISYTAKKLSEVEFHALGMAGPMSAAKVLEEHPKAKEHSSMTKGWDTFPFFIDASNEVMCMLPFTNSERTGKVSEDTTDVFVECTGTDKDNVVVALHILVSMLADMGGQVYQVTVEYPDGSDIQPTFTPSRMQLNVEFINKLIGLKLTKEECGSYLKRMGYGIEGDEVLIPSYRADVLHQVDLAKDAAVAYGYENIEASIPQVATIGKEAPLEQFISKLRVLLASMQCEEVRSYHLTSLQDLNEKMGLEMDAVELCSSHEEYHVLRSWMIPSMLKVLKQNRQHDYPQHIFEIGRVFVKKENTETGVQEYERLAITLAEEKADFTQVKQVVDYLFRLLGKEYTLESTQHASFIPGRVGRISVDGKKVGYIGEIHPQVLSNWELIVPVAAVEINVSELFETFDL